MRTAILNSERMREYDLGHGLTGIEIELAEPYGVPPEYKSDYAVLETEQIVETVKAKLASYWNCFASS